MADEKRIAASADRLHGRIWDRVAIGNRFHFQVVANDRAIKTDFPTQRRENERGERGRPLRIERRKHHVRRHHTGHACFGGRNEWRPFNLTQARDGVWQRGQLPMRIFERVTVARKMFRTPVHSFALQTAHERRGERGDKSGLTRKRAIPNHRIVRIRIHVHDWRKIEIEADGSELAPELSAHGLRHRLAPIGHLPHRGKFRQRCAEALHPPAFLIDAHDERRFAQRLELANQLESLLWRFDVAAEQNHTAHAEVTHQRTRSVADVRVRNSCNDQASGHDTFMPKPTPKNNAVALVRTHKVSTKEGMEVVPGFAALAAPLRAPVVTIGNFDGVHRGHLALFAHVEARAQTLGGQSVVYTFEPHPVQILAPHLAPPRLTTALEKQRLLAAAGIDVCIAEPFNQIYAETPADQFVSQVLVSRIGVRELVVGYDFTYGRGGAGNTGTLARAAEQFGFSLQVVNQQMFSGIVASSTKIRELVLEGKIEGAAMLLGRDYCLLGEVVHGDARGRTIGFPTANLDTADVLVPRNGVYACWLEVEGVPYRAITNIGLRPTVTSGVTKATVEAHIFDFSADIYGKQVRLSFVKRLRDEQRFSSLDALKAQITIDSAEARRVLG